jgi:hypothetical protein
MQQWIGAVNNKNGNAFNETVRAIMESTGFHARSSVQMRELGADGLGDVDVLAWTKALDIAIVIECKHLRFARSVAEVGEQLRRFRGRPGDELHAHIRRVKWLSENPESLKKKIGLRDGFRIHQLLVTERLVPMAFVKELAIPPETVISADRLRASVETFPLVGEVNSER